MTPRLPNVQLDVPSERYDATVTFWAEALGAPTRPGVGPCLHLLCIVPDREDGQ